MSGIELDKLSGDELLKLLVRHHPKYRGMKDLVAGLPQSPTPKRRKPYDRPDLSQLPAGQRRAVEALIGGGVDRTYSEAARIAGMAEGTLLTHVNRVRQNHPELYAEIRTVRKPQLGVRPQSRMPDCMVGNTFESGTGG